MAYTISIYPRQFTHAYTRKFSEGSSGPGAIVDASWSELMVSVLSALQWRRWRHFRNMKTRCFLSLWMMMACSSQQSKWISTREFCLLFVFSSIFADFGSQGIEHRKGGHKLSEDPLCYKRSFVDFFSPSYQHNRSGRGRCRLLFFCDTFMRLNWVLKCRSRSPCGGGGGGWWDPGGLPYRTDGDACREVWI